KEETLQDSDIHQLIEECSTEVSEEQKQRMEDTMLELVKIYRQKELLCIHDNEVKNVVEQPAERGNNTIESLQNFRVIHKNSISLKNTSQFSSIHAVTPILSTKEHEYSPSMGENEVTSEDKRECDVPVFENSPIGDNHSEIFSDSNNDDDISSNDDDFEDIEYVEVSLSDPEIVSVEEENVVQQEEEEVDLEDISQIQDVDLREKLLSITRLVSNIESLNDNPTLDHAEYDAGEKIPVVMNDKDKNVDYSSYIFVIFAKVFSLLSAESEDTIFDP
nr:hypothetical protein [Tanacetum cinerariifolium]